MYCERCDGQGLLKVPTDDGYTLVPCEDCGGSGILDCSEGAQRLGTGISEEPGPIIKTHYPLEKNSGN